MPSKAKPFFRKQTGWWMLNLRSPSGKRVQKKLIEGEDQGDEAERIWHEIMAAEPGRRAKMPAVKVDRGSIFGLIDEFMVGTKPNISAKTYRGYKDFLDDFMAFVELQLDRTDRLALFGEVADLRVHHVQSWINARTDWSNSTKNGAVGAVRRCFRWLTEMQYLEHYPLFGLKAPRKETREVVLSDKDFEAVIKAAKDETFRDLLNFVLNTGCRPQEVCGAEIRHVQLKSRRIVFPKSEAKGKRAPRVIYLNDAAFSIAKRHVGERERGPLFLNRRKAAWTSNAIRQRFKRLATDVGGARYCAYHLRHTFATDALENGLDAITISTLMGHADASTLARTYQHLAKNPKHMIEAAKKAR